MLKGSTRPLALLQESLLGQAASDVLAIGELEAEVDRASQALAAPLLRLCQGTEGDRGTALSAEQLAWRMREPLGVLHAWTLAITADGISASMAPTSLEDFSNFVGMARSLAESRGAAGPSHLMHLLGLASIRARLEAHVGLTPLIALPTLWLSPGLSVVEIAAVCGLKLTTVRNAVSRREVPHSRETGVPLDEALDWMIQRSGFLYPHLNAASWERRINGRLASGWLAECAEVEFERYVSRLRLSLWRVTSSGRRLAINAEGVRNCVLLLPDMEEGALDGLGMERLDERSHDPAAEMHREVLMLGPGESLWQCQAPTLRSLKALIARLGSDTLSEPPAPTRAMPDQVAEALFS